MANLGPLAAEIGPVIWGTPANFHGFRILAALLHGSLVVGVSRSVLQLTAAYVFHMSSSRFMIKAKFHYAILVADRSEAGRRSAASWNLAISSISLAAR